MSSHYVHVFNQGQKRRMVIDPSKGLGKYLKNQDVLNKRVWLESPEELQQRLEQGEHFAILKFDPHRFRWKQMVVFHQQNASVQNDELIINHNPKPLKLAGLSNVDPHNLDVLTIQIPATSIPTYAESTTAATQLPAQEIPYYVHIYHRGKKQRLTINLQRGLGNYLTCNNILQRRVLATTPQEAIAILQQGHQFAILKFDNQRFRWKSLILFDQNNARIEQGQLIINETSKPLEESGFLVEDPANLNVLTIIHATASANAQPNPLPTQPTQLPQPSSLSTSS